MSKVWEDEVIRDADTTEQTDIEKNGGGSSRFELIKSISITEDRNNFIFELDNSYDELLLELTDVKGTEGAALNLQCRTTGKVAFNLTQDINSFLSETTAKSIQVIFERTNFNTWNVIRSGQNVLFKKIDNVLSYDEKIYFLRIRAGSNVFKEGTIKIYGRNLTNE